MRILVYLGVNTGSTFRKIYRNFDLGYGFEAVPKLAESLKRQFSGPGVKIIHAAACTENQPQVLYLSRNKGGKGNKFESSSLGKLND